MRLFYLLFGIFQFGAIPPTIQCVSVVFVTQTVTKNVKVSKDFYISHSTVMKNLTKFLGFIPMLMRNWNAVIYI